MKTWKFFLLGLGGTVSLQFFAFPSVAAPICASSLQREIRAIADTPELKPSRLGILAATLTSPPKIAIDLDGDRFFSPASNVKLFTTAAALRQLGANFRTRTYIMAKRSVDGAIARDLLVFGGGDPTFSRPKLASLVQQLAAKGIRRVEGTLSLGSEFADRPTEDSGLGYGWEWQDLQEDFAAIASPLTIDENAILWTVTATRPGQRARFQWDDPTAAAGWTAENAIVTGLPDSAENITFIRIPEQKKIVLSGSIPQNAKPYPGATAIPDPKAQFERMFRAALGELNLQSNPISSPIAPLTFLRKTPSEYQVVAEVMSPPLSDLIRTANKESNNLYAELILRLPAWRQSPIPDRPVYALQAPLQALGIEPERYTLADGSGLSRRSLVTPRAIVQLLVTMRNDSVFRDSLAIAGVDGTLSQRFRGTVAANRLRGKTGTLDGAIALSGYVKPADYDELAFSILIDRSRLPSSKLRAYVDAIALLLANLRAC